MPARAASLLLELELAAEREGVVADVVFPTAIDLRDDGVADVYYGMADTGSASTASRCPLAPPRLNR